MHARVCARHATLRYLSQSVLSQRKHLRLLHILHAEVHNQARVVAALEIVPTRPTCSSKLRQLLFGHARRLAVVNDRFRLASARTGVLRQVLVCSAGGENRAKGQGRGHIGMRWG